MEMTMKKMIFGLGCFLLVLSLAPCLHAETAPTFVAQADLAAPIFAPADGAATASPAEPVAAAPLDLFFSSLQPTLKVIGCTGQQCIAQCSDCPWGYYGYCISTATCRCGCRH
jgi:hypothetical protein